MEILTKEFIGTKLMDILERIGSERKSYRVKIIIRDPSDCFSDEIYASEPDYEALFQPAIDGRQLVWSEKLGRYVDINGQQMPVNSARWLENNLKKPMDSPDGVYEYQIAFGKPDTSIEYIYTRILTDIMGVALNHNIYGIVIE